MALDGITLHFIKEEISEYLIGAKVEKIYQPSRCELVFLMRTRSGAYRLYMSCEAISPRIHLTRFTPENPQQPPMLCMLFRKRLVGAKLTEIKQLSFDRVISLSFDSTNEIGDKVKLKIYLEIMAQRSNIVLVSENGKIIDAVKRVDETKSTYREVLPGGTYVLPPTQNKMSVAESGYEEITEEILKKSNQKLSSAVLSTLEGVSPIVCREIAYRCADDDIPVGEINSHQLECLKSEIKGLCDTVNSGSYIRQVVFDTEGKPMDFSFIEITQYGSSLKKQNFETFSELLDYFCFEKDRIMRIKRRAGDLYKVLNNATERISKKINLQRIQLRKCADKDELQIFAELISSNLYRLEKGAGFYEVENYYDNNKPVRIAVNPALTPVQNSQKYYKEYKKAVTAEKMLAGLIESGEQELIYIDSVLDSLSRADTEAELAEIRAELAQGGYIKRRGRNKVKLPKTLPPYEFKTSDGFRVLIGRNNVQNDRLSLKTAKNYDMWLHTQGYAGSHTIIVSDNREITETAVEEAASLAAAFSSAKDAEKVPVDYTLVKNLKKPKNALPGRVIYHIYNTIYVSPAKKDKLDTAVYEN